MKTEFYQDAAGEWRWRMTAKNNKIVGASCEGFKNREDCEYNYDLVTTRTWSISYSNIAIVFACMMLSAVVGFISGMVASRH